MTFEQRFISADEFLIHTDLLMAEIDDPMIQQSYVGFITVSAVTVYELAIKDIIFKFSDEKHEVLGSVSRHVYERWNGRIRLKELRKDHIRRFGDIYVDEFNRVLEQKEKDSLREGKGSIENAYTNIILWRNKFAHSGETLTTTNYNEVKNSYNLGKEVIYSLDKAMS